MRDEFSPQTITFLISRPVVINDPIDIELVKERSLETWNYPFPKSI